MKAVILAGGLGTRIGEETLTRPKPMVEVGGKPILWHILNIYAAHGITEFVICLGYLGHVIKEYFANYRLFSSDMTVDLATGTIEWHRPGPEPWRVSLIETGEATMTGGRLRRALSHVGDGDFCLAYGDCVADIDIAGLVAFHRAQGRKATVSVVHPTGRFGAVRLEGGRVADFAEKPEGGDGWVNGGFFVLSPEVGAYIADDAAVWEREPMERLAREGELSAYRHEGFWHPMDTPRDKAALEEMWRTGRAPWKIW